VVSKDASLFTGGPAVRNTFAPARSPDQLGYAGRDRDGTLAQLRGLIDLWPF
jgi:hypothetical protein